MRLDIVMYKILEKFYENGDSWSVPLLKKALEENGINIEAETLRKRLDLYSLERLIDKIQGANPTIYEPRQANFTVGLVRLIAAYLVDGQIEKAKQMLERHRWYVNHNKKRVEKLLDTMSKNLFVTSIEHKIREQLISRGIEFKPNEPILGTLPDIFIEPNICIFCDGDYWHNLPKIRSRDVFVNKHLRESGYTTLRFWEHEINNNIDSCVTEILNSLPTRKEQSQKISTTNK